jgi:hypothetical protein
MAYAQPFPPGPPRNLVLTQISGAFTTLHLTWDYPLDNGGAPILDFFPVIYPGGLVCFAPPVPSPQCSFTGLMNGVAYRAVVIASNDAGNGIPSDSSNAVTVTRLRPGIFPIRISGSSRPFTFSLTPEGAVFTEDLTMSISDVYGRTVWTRTVNPSKDGTRELSWDARTTSGRAVSAGVYMVRVSTVSGGTTADFIRPAATVR